MASRSSPGAFPYVVVWRGMLDGNRHVREELTSHRTEEAARKAAIAYADRWHSFIKSDVLIGCWSVIDVRTGATLSECY